jgi:hypothetical protein
MNPMNNKYTAASRILIVYEETGTTMKFAPMLSLIHLIYVLEITI